MTTLTPTTQLTMSICALMLCAAGPTAFAAEGAAEGEEPRRDGIASRYVGDVGIAEDPAVLFAEDFEDDQIKARGWYDTNGWPKRLLVTDEDQATGSRSLKLVYPKGSTGPWLRAPHFKQGQDTVHVRYYRKWSDDWDWGGPGDGNGHDTRLVASGPDIPSRAYKSHDAIAVNMESCTHFDPWKRGLFGLMLINKKEYLTDTLKQIRKGRNDEGHKLRGHEWWLATVDGSRSPKSEPGQWYCVEYMAQMNTPGEADGRLQCWIDGKLVYDIQDCTIRDADHADVQWHRWWIGPYFHGGTTKDQHSYIDSVVIATEYIGPKQDAE